MNKRNFLIDEFIDNLYEVETDTIGFILSCLREYLLLSNFEFESDNIMEQEIKKEVLKEFINWFSSQDAMKRCGFTVSDCVRVINFTFYEYV